MRVIAATARSVGLIGLPLRAMRRKTGLPSTTKTSYVFQSVLLPLAGEFGAVVTNVFPTQVVLDPGTKILFRLERLVEESSEALRA